MSVEHSRLSSGQLPDVMTHEVFHIDAAVCPVSCNNLYLLGC